MRTIIRISLAILISVAGMLLGYQIFARISLARQPVKVEPITDAVVGYGRIAMPVGRIFLVRADLSYCAVRFTKERNTVADPEYSAEYESWCQGDGTGDFSKPNVLFVKDKLWWKRPIGIGRLWLFTRQQNEIRCGGVTLEWWGRTTVQWIPKKTISKFQNILFAPTPWTSISQVDVNDKRIIWYEPGTVEGDRYRNISIPVDRLWEVDLNKEREFQISADKGHQPWRLDPVSVAYAAVVEVDRTAKFENCEVTCYTGNNKAHVLCKGIKEYEVELRRLIRTTEHGIWTAVSVEVNKK